MADRSPWKIIEYNGRRYRVAVTKESSGVWVGWDGGEFFFRSRGSDSAVEEEEAPEGELRAPMTGRITDVRIEVGSQVEKDQVLAVMEAMKMEHPLKAPFAGTVAQMECEKDQRVSRGDLMIRLDAIP